MPVSKKGVAYRPLRAFSVRVAVFCAWGVYNLTSRRAMRSVCWLAALALAALTLMCSCRPFALARGSLCALAPPQAGGCKHLRPCLSARPPVLQPPACSVVASLVLCSEWSMLLPSVPPCPWLPVRFGSSASSSLQTPPSVPVGTTSVVCRLLPAP